MGPSDEQMLRIQTHARALWGVGDYSVRVEGRMASLVRGAESLLRVAAMFNGGRAIDALEAVLQKRVGNII